MKQKLLKRGILWEKALYCFLAILITFPLNLLIVPSINATGPTLSDAKVICEEYATQGKIVVMFSDKLAQSPNYPLQSGPVQIDIPAGVYKVRAISQDGYDGRSSSLPEQKAEQWYAILNDSGNNNIATTGAISDLDDSVDYVINNEIVDNNLIVSTDVSFVTAHHIKEDPKKSANSVCPVCTVFSPIIQDDPNIAIVKTANPTSLPVGGGNVDYTYVVTNSGNVPLSNIVLTDDKLGIITVFTGDDNSNDILEITEIWTYTANTDLTVDTINIVTVTGEYNSNTVSDTAEATVTVEIPSQDDPAIAITKTANPTSLPVGGGNVDYTYVVTNPGDVALVKIKLVDDKLGELTSYTGDDNSDDILDLTETWTYITNTNITANTTNVAVVTGEYNTNGDTVEATDVASVSVSSGGGGVSYRPAIRIIKTPKPRTLPVGGGEVIYTYEVTNPGHYALSNVTLVDDKCDGIEFKEGDKNTNDKLDRGEIWKYTCQTQLTETTINTVVVTGESVKGNVTDTAKATVSVPTIDLAIRLEKTVNPESFSEKGGLATYFYEVFNEGVKAISDVTLVDDKCAPVTFTGGDTNGDNKLDPTEIWIYTCESNITKTTTNTGTVRGQVDGKYATDISDAIVRVERIKGIIPEEMPKTGHGSNAIIAGYNWQQALFIIFALLSITVLVSKYKRKLQ